MAKVNEDEKQVRTTIELKYIAMQLIALCDAGIPLEILHKMEPDDIGWEEARSSAASDYAAVLREAKQRIAENTDDTCWEESSISAASDYAAALE